MPFVWEGVWLGPFRILQWLHYFLSIELLAIVYNALLRCAYQTICYKVNKAFFKSLIIKMFLKICHIAMANDKIHLVPKIPTIQLMEIQHSLL